MRNSDGRMCTLLRGEQIFISHWKEIVHVYVYYFQYRYGPPLGTLYKRSLTLHMIYFFLYSRNLDINFYSSCASPERKHATTSLEKHVTAVVQDGFI